jgi:choline dehydrogenase
MLKPMTQANKEFHYILIGAGASGCIIANRLSAHPATQVLVLEAGGPDQDPNIADIGGFVRLWGSEVDWQLPTLPQAGLGNRAITINQGKVLGGSSSINAMMYVRGNPANFDDWAAAGAEGWAYEQVLPFFRKIEDYSGGDAAYHGRGGEISISDCPEEHMRSTEFLNAAWEAGYNAPLQDYNGPIQSDSAGYLQFHISKDNKRESSATAFLHPVRHRDNLTVLTGAQAKKIIFEGDTATGVEYVLDGQTFTAYASREVIVCAGALASPKLLLLSGIGPAAELQQAAIPVVKDLPGVGQNLQDHLQLPVIFQTTLDLPHTTLLTGNVLFVKTNPSATAPDIQINFTPSLPAPLAPLLPDFGFPVCIFLAILVQPLSRGEVKIASPDFAAAPLINPNYLQHRADVEALAQAIAIIRKIAAQPSFRPLNAREILPAQAPLEEYIRSQSTTLWHPAGTCKMGKDKLAVVDARLKVHGLKKLRVADASVMPAVTSGNTVATCFMIGEKAAAMIREDNREEYIT